MKVLFDFSHFCKNRVNGINHLSMSVLSGDDTKLSLIEEDARDKGFDIGALDFSPVNFFHAPLKGKMYVSDIVIKPSQHPGCLMYSGVITFDESKL